MCVKIYQNLFKHVTPHAHLNIYLKLGFKAVHYYGEDWREVMSRSRFSLSPRGFGRSVKMHTYIDSESESERALICYFLSFFLSCWHVILQLSYAKLTFDFSLHICTYYKYTHTLKKKQSLTIGWKHFKWV
jgi:hypothetical protein